MRLNQRALSISTVLLSLWLLVLPPVSAAGTGGNSSDAGVPPTIPGLVPGNANAPVAVSVICSPRVRPGGSDEAPGAGNSLGPSLPHHLEGTSGGCRANHRTSGRAAGHATKCDKE